jgi:uncharacterized membrane protein
MPATAAFCPGCGQTMRSAPRAEGKVGAFPENVAGALAYLTLLPAIIFLVRDPYKQNQFVRFHSAQCLLIWAAGAIIASLLRLSAVLMVALPVVGPLAIVLTAGLLAIAGFVIWLVLIVKALQGDRFKLPWLGELAERHARTT